MKLYFPKSNIPNFVILLIDLFLCLISISIAYLVRFDLSLNGETLKSEFDIVKYCIPIYLVVKLMFFQITRSHRSLVRFTNVDDMLKIVRANFYSTLIFILFGVYRFYYIDNYYFLPKSIVLIEFFICCVVLISFRLFVRFLYTQVNQSAENVQNVILYGAGEAGVITLKTIESDLNIINNVVGFVDDSRRFSKSMINGVRIYHTSQLEELIHKFNVTKLIIAIAHPKANLKNKVLEVCFKNNVEVHKIPSARSWINGELTAKQISKYNIEDLLGRESIILNPEQVKNQYFDKVILVTGAAGSIGSGIVRQLVQYNPKKVILLDQAESPIYDIQNELLSDYQSLSFDVVVADICSKQRIKEVFQLYHPEIVFHAAAYKHVPLMEENPFESIHTNIFGTKNLVDTSIEYLVDKFVMISTDKAVNPTNVMGASKRIAEIYTQTIQSSKTKFITTRFGNVLGSNGSVIPLFKKQIEKGGPITITDPEVTRYFMTIPEACSLVLEAGSFGEGSEIFVFDMGNPVKILDLAEKMINLSGMKIDKDIEIKFTGLRPGEKLYEELLAEEENTIQTHHPKILIANTRKEPPETLIEIENLINATSFENNFELVGRMKKIVPEFVSNNSIYSKLDK